MRMLRAAWGALGAQRSQTQPWGQCLVLYGPLQIRMQKDSCPAFNDRFPSKKSKAYASAMGMLTVSLPA